MGAAHLGSPGLECGSPRRSVSLGRDPWRGAPAAPSGRSFGSRRLRAAALHAAPGAHRVGGGGGREVARAEARLVQGVLARHRHRGRDRPPGRRPVAARLRRLACLFGRDLGAAPADPARGDAAGGDALSGSSTTSAAIAARSLSPRNAPAGGCCPAPITAGSTSSAAKGTTPTPDPVRPVWLRGLATRMLDLGEVRDRAFATLIKEHNRLADALRVLRNEAGTVSHGKDGFIRKLSVHHRRADKPMRGHGLMQAIARVNRVFQDKPAGLVVDYIASLRT